MGDTNRELQERLRWLVRARWIVVVILGPLGILVNQLMGREFEYLVRPLTLVLIVLLYNFAFRVTLTRVVTSRALRGMGYLQLVFDLLAVTALIHLSGGIESPLLLLYFLAIVVAGSLLPTRGAYAIASLSIFFYGGLLFGQYLRLIPHYYSPYHRYAFSTEIYQDPSLLMAFLLIIGGWLYAAAFLTEHLSNLVRAREARIQQLYQEAEERARAVEQLNRRLLAFQETSRAVSSTLALTEVLRAVQENIASILPEAYPLFALVDEEEQVIRPILVFPENPVQEQVRRVIGVGLEELALPLSELTDRQRENIQAGKVRVTDKLSEVLGRLLSEPVLTMAQEVFGISALVSAPLVSRGNFLGVMFLFVRHDVEPPVLELLKSLAEQAAIAIEHARLYEEVRDARSYLQNVIASSPDAIAATDEHGILTFWSPGSQRIMGFKAKEMLGQPVWKYYVGGIEEAHKVMSILKEKGELRDYETWLWHKDGHKVLVSLSASLLKDERGNIIGTLGVARDITERKRAEEALRQEAQKLAALVEMNRAITEDIGLQGTLDRILTNALKIIPVSECSVTLVDETSGDLVVQASTNGEVGVRIDPAASSGVGWVVKTKQVLAEEDVPTNPIFDQQLVQRYGIKSALVVPIVYKDRALGALGFAECRTRRAFGEIEIMMAQAFAHQAAVAIENARLFEETRRRAERLSLVNRIARAAGATLRLDKLVEIVYQEVTRVFQADAFFLALYDPEANELDYRLRVDEGIREPLERRPLTTGLTALVVTGRKPVLIRDFEQEKDHLPPVRLWGTMRAPPSWLGVPMLIGDRVVGVISVQAYRPAAYDEEEVQLLSTIADQVAVAVENARLYEETRQRAETLAALHETSLDLAAQPALPDLLRAIVARAVALLDARGGGLYLYRPATDDLEYVLTYNLRPDFTGAVLKRGEGLSGKVLETGQSMAVADYRHWEGRAAQYEQAGFTACVAVPVSWSNRPLGVLNVLDDAPRTFSPADIALLERLTPLAAAALEQTRLLEAERRQRQEAETLREAALALTTTLDRNEVVERILGQLQQVVPYDTASVQLLKGDRLEIIGGRGFPNLPELLGISFPIDGHNPNREVVRARAPFIVEDAPAVYEEFRREPHAPAKIHSWLGVPMLVGERLVGMIALDQHEPAFYTAEHARLALAFATQAAIVIENARLFEEEQRRAAQLAAVARVGERIASILNPDELLRETVELIARTFGYYHVAVMVLDAETDELVFTVAAGGYADRTPAGSRQKVREGMIGWAAYLGETLLANDVSQEPRYIAPFLTETRSELDVPLKHRGRVIGVLDLQSTELNAFSQHDVMAMETLADYIAAALENARLFEEERRRAAQLAVVNEVGRHAASTLELDQILHDVTIAIQTGFGYYDVATFLVEGEYAVLKAHAGGFAPAVKDGYRQHLSQGIVGWAIRQDQTVLANDVNRHPHYIPAFPGEAELVRSELCVPIRADGQVLGVLDVASTELNAFDQWDVMAVETLADQIALAVKNALAYGRLGEEKRRLELLYEVAADVNRSLDLDEILARAIERITARLGGKVGYVFLVEPGTDRFRLWAASGVEVSMAKFNEMFDVRLGQGVIGWVAAHCQPAVVDDVTQDERWLYVDELDRGTRSMMSVPLVRGEETLGALSVLHPTPGFFDEEQCRLLMAIAQQVAVAVANARLHETVREQAMLDSLTQVYNHSELIRRLGLAVEEGAREDQPVSYIMLDIDYFKEYNDRYGHVTGDLILTAIVQAIRANIKKIDVVGRWGGEEFGIVLPHTDAAKARVVAERIRYTLATMPLTDGKGREVPKPTVSQGIATYPITADSAEELIDLADAALYRAKARGKDQVHVAWFSET